MPQDTLDRLASLIRHERETLLSRWRRQVRELPSAKHLDVPTLNDHLPRLLDELIVALQSKIDASIPETLHQGSSTAHGVQRVRDDFDIEEVVAEYNILRECIHDLGDSRGLSLQGKPFHILNRILDNAIGQALQAYAAYRALEVQKRREEYLAFVAHDLRTPLNAISLATNVLERTLPKNDGGVGVAQMLKTLRRNVEHLGSLVSKILEENANLQTEVGVKLERRMFDLWPLVEALIHDCHPIAGTGSTQLINQVPEDLVIYADASLMRRIYQNLIANAVKYTPHGEVVVGARPLNDQGAVETWVGDNGAGIPPARLAMVFDQLETDPKEQGGLGLGLAIVKTFVEAHEGTVAVESKEGLGSTFRITLPAKRL